MAAVLAPGAAVVVAVGAGGVVGVWEGEAAPVVEPLTLGAPAEGAGTLEFEFVESIGNRNQ
jgi:hypothetical protein